MSCKQLQTYDHPIIQKWVKFGTTHENSDFPFTDHHAWLRDSEVPNINNSSIPWILKSLSCIIVTKTIYLVDL